ncbi:alpha/beta hydrolase family protein [Aquimarina muelleri]|uniref:Alpha/beta hydrolase n=1 Tax=Aquimarina muelleri TaxID=279356 RepID=A0A918JRT3_9FLAO|nr:alpha/beta fold hydrolase [Aquimarina muelleri]MCX2761685.1 alpha/beta fold hydrolase [Aquimarina muelleri]GGX07128.1 alpha/beta hydrolase [Aquimarina muelleri]
MIVKNKNIQLEGKHQKPILTDVFYKEEQFKKPVVIFCHGYKGFKDWGAWDLVATTFADAGFLFVKFNFSYNGGTILQPIDFPDLEAFGNNNYIKELDDLNTVVDWVTSPNFEFKNQIDSSNIIVVGHSRGGGIATIKAAEDSRVTKLITWASVSDYKSRFPEGEILDKWREDGVMYIENGRTKQKMPHYFQFYTSYIQNEERLNIAIAAKKNKIPHLIIHGTKDPTVNVQESRQIKDWSTNSELFLVKGADHVFGIKHPWENKSLSTDLEVVLQKSIDFASL